MTHFWFFSCKKSSWSPACWNAQLNIDIRRFYINKKFEPWKFFQICIIFCASITNVWKRMESVISGIIQIYLILHDANNKDNRKLSECKSSSKICNWFNCCYSLRKFGNFFCTVKPIVATMSNGSPTSTKLLQNFSLVISLLQNSRIRFLTSVAKAKFVYKIRCTCFVEVEFGASLIAIN